jgi:hypothetical protein
MTEREELLAQLDIVIDLSVEDEGDRTIVTPHWLCSAIDIDDGETPVPEADLMAPARGIALPVSRSVWAPVFHQVSEADEGFVVLPVLSLEYPAKNTAHRSSPDYTIRTVLELRTALNG